MSERTPRPCGSSSRSGRKHVRANDGLPTAKELRDLSRRFNSSSYRSRCGRPGRVATPEYRVWVMAKLKAAAKGGRGIRFLSRDELDVVLQMCREAELPPTK